VLHLPGGKPEITLSGDAGTVFRNMGVQGEYIPFPEECLRLNMDMDNDA